MIFHKPKKHITAISLKIDYTPIEKVKDFHFLGLVINEYLNWKMCTKYQAAFLKQ